MPQDASQTADNEIRHMSRQRIAYPHLPIACVDSGAYARRISTFACPSPASFHSLVRSTRNQSGSGSGNAKRRWTDGIVGAEKSWLPILKGPLP